MDQFWKCSLVTCVLLVTASEISAQPTNPAALSGPRLIETYGTLLGRSVLTGPLGVTITNVPADTNAAIEFIETEMQKQGIEAVRDGINFVRLQPTNWRGSPVDNYLKTIPRPGTNQVSVPAGMINMMGADLNQLLGTYSSLRNRTVLRSPQIHAIQPIFFKNLTGLTTDETIYAYRVLLALNQVAVVDDGEKFFWVVPILEASRVEAGSAKLDPKSKLIARERIPVFQGRPVTPQKTTQPLTERLTQAAADLYKKLTSPPEPPKFPATVDAVFGFYGKLVDKQPVMGTNIIRNQPLFFNATTPLTKAELIYAIEAMFKLYQIGIVPVDEETIRALPLWEALKLKTNNPPAKANSPPAPRKSQ